MTGFELPSAKQSRFDALIHSKDSVSIACMNELLEAFNLVVTPKHGKRYKTKIPGTLRDPRTPGIDADGRKRI